MKVTSNSSIGDQQVWPPGFRFHPTDEELILYHLKRKICRRRLKLDIIGETDVYKWDPEDLPGQSKLKTGDRQWFFFSPRDRKYPNGARSNRATRYGYWKVTGKDRNVICNSRTVGVKKTLVFYQGRAPNGERTDWVMHEYTLDEEELKRCQTAGDYYALYKVYKKSGPGPKNGEQYGAPFKEEEWADDEVVEVSNYDQANPAKQPNEIASVDNLRVTSVQSPLVDIGEIINRITDEPAPRVPPITDSTLTLPQVFGDVSHSTIMVDSSVKEANFTERSIVLHQNSQQCGVDASFDFTQSATSILQYSEVTSAAPNIYEQDSHISEEDFLEMDDLIGPEPTPLNAQKPTDSPQFDGLDGLNEFDLLHDADMFLRDIGSIDHVTVSHPYLNNLENEMVNQLNYQLPSHPDDVNQFDSQLWTHDLKTNVFTPTESDMGGVYLPTPGVVCVESSTNIPIEATLYQNGQEGDSDQNWFTSALWAFVESIPTTPASASENALVNRAFERMSSFSRVRIIATNTDVSAGNGTATARKANKSSVFFLFSVLGVIFAILWVFMKGKTAFVFGRNISL